MEVLTFLSDFGWDQGYVAACELVIARLAPAVRIIHLSHDVAPGAVLRGAELLQRTLPLGPAGVHLAVIDPGVGSTRRALCLAAGRGDYVVGPDNGLLLPAVESLGGLTGSWELVPSRVRSLAQLPDGLSSTFHGRDLFSPAAALLATGRPASALGDPLDPATLVRPLFPAPRWEVAGVWAEVTETDRFGNIQLGVNFAEAVDRLKWRQGARVSVTLGHHPIHSARLVATFADLKTGDLGLLSDSWGKATLACNMASAAALLGVMEGEMVGLVSEATAKEMRPHV